MRLTQTDSLITKSRHINRGQRVSPGDLVVDEAGGFSFLRGLGTGQLSAALGHIQALQARDLTQADDPEGADSCEREEDSFMVIKSIAKVLQYKIVLKTVRTLFDYGSIGTHESFPFVASFAGLYTIDASIPGSMLKTGFRAVLNIIKVPAVEESDLPSMDFFVHQKKRLSEVVTKSVVLVDESILHPYAQLELLHACSLLV
ncbi:hypothetical protein Tco_1512171, partial [Tanacetum coccineum]